MNDYNIALRAIAHLPVSEVRMIALRLGKHQPKHQKRCEAIARYLVLQHEQAIVSAPDASWLPPNFDIYVQEWVNEIFGR